MGNNIVYKVHNLTTWQELKYFPLTTYLVNVTISAVSCGFGHITEEIVNGSVEHFTFCALDNWTARWLKVHKGNLSMTFNAFIYLFIYFVYLFI